MDHTGFCVNNEFLYRLVVGVGQVKRDLLRERLLLVDVQIRQLSRLATGNGPNDLVELRPHHFVPEGLRDGRQGSVHHASENDS